MEIPTDRTNRKWLSTLASGSQEQEAALEELRLLLLRATLYTLASHADQLQAVDEQDRSALAEDCAQEALLAVLSHLQEFRGESKFTTWAYKFGVNIALTRLRHERWKKVSLSQLSDDAQALDWLQSKGTLQTADSERPVLQAEVHQVLHETIQNELSLRQRQVLKWIAFDDVPMDVVVERLGSNRNAIYKLLHDARLKVRQRLEARGYDLEKVYDLFQSGG
jgi:RNA polymerase sigma-70 factor (ECF subfamily)